MHDAYASIYRINMFNIIINQLICTDILNSMQLMSHYFISFH